MKNHVIFHGEGLTELRRDVGEVKVNMATLTERVSHLPSKDFIVKVALAIVGAVTALTAFAERIQSWVN